ncbi:MAG: TldD/PmbA family protein, partial [Candidatus Scalindua sp.]
LSIVDDGTLEGEAGYNKYDSEGTPTQKTYLIKDGILTSRLHSRETAAKMNESPTGNARAINYAHEPIVRMTCTYMEPRSWTFEDMLANTDDGIYAIGSLGGQTNTEMFTFSAEEAYQIRGGKLCEKIRDVVLTGNVFETLMNIDAIGNDLTLYGGLGGCGKGGQSPLRVSDGGPHIRIRNVTIGGR